MTKKTTRLVKLPWDPHAPGEYYDQGHLGKMFRKWRENPPSWYFRLWHWHLKKWVQPFYPINITKAIKRFYQRRIYGYDDTDFWSLDLTFSKFILPRLREFRRRAADPNITSGYPMDCDPCYPKECHCPSGSTIAHNDWLTILDNMIYAFESDVLDNDLEYDSNFQTDFERLRRGRELFSRFYNSLWE